MSSPPRFFAAAFDLPAPTVACACRCVPRVALASRTATRDGVPGPIEPPRLTCGSSNGVRRRTAIQASDARRWIDAHAFDGVWCWMAVQASDRLRGRLLSDAPRPATSNAAAAAPIAMRRTARPLAKLGRCALFTAGRLRAPSGCADAGPEFVAGARQGGSAGRRRRHAAQRPLSPGAGGYKAPQLVHPPTAAGVFMLPMYRSASSRFTCEPV